MKILVAMGAAAVALSAVPADARHNDNRGNGRACATWRHGQCVRWMNHGYVRATAVHQRNAARAAYRVGYRFGPDYSYTDVGSLPRPYVTRYHLSPDYRYVYRDNRIYVVDPTTYAVRRVIDAITR
jgi:hypothetical protein